MRMIKLNKVKEFALQDKFIAIKNRFCVIPGTTLLQSSVIFYTYIRLDVIKNVRNSQLKNLETT